MDKLPSSLTICCVTDALDGGRTLPDSMVLIPSAFFFLRPLARHLRMDSWGIFHRVWFLIILFWLRDGADVLLPYNNLYFQSLWMFLNFSTHIPRKQECKEGDYHKYNKIKKMHNQFPVIWFWVCVICRKHHSWKKR